MAYEDEILWLMNQLVIADKHIIASLMTHRWADGTSAVNNSKKTLDNLVALDKLAKGKGFYKLPHSKSEYKEHAQLLTKALAEILKLNFKTNIFRERTIEEVGLRPDAIVFLERNGKGLCFILEVCNNETEDYLMQKINTWKWWDKAKEFLSMSLDTKIPSFDVVVSGGSVEGAFEFSSYLEEIRNG